MNTNDRQSYLFPILLGLMAFISVAGIQFLDPTNVAWLVGGDPLQHYLGWAFYRNGPWTWPVGLNPLYGMEFSNSIVFTDSIPLLAIPFKAINFLLPYPFQYLGIWVLLCFVLQAYFAFRLIGLFSSNLLVQCLGSIFFLFAPPMLFRLSLHESLMAHFLVLAAIYFNLKPTKTKFIHTLAWIILLSIAVLTHFYLAVMVLVLWVADLLSRFFVSRRVSIKATAVETLLMTLIVIFVAWQAGYFAIEGASGASRGFGDFRTNLLALFNSRGWSYWLKPIPLRDSVEAATGEGFQYFGSGSLILLVAAAYALIVKKFNLTQSIKSFWIKHCPLIIALAFLAIISFSNRIGFGPWNFTIPLPDLLLNIFSLVRASSRLFWPLYYVILLGIIWVVVKAYAIRTALFILMSAAILQVVDTSAGWLTIRAKVSVPTSSEFISKLTNSFWKEAGKHYRNIVVNGGQQHWEEFGVLASKHHMATNITYLARADVHKEQQSFTKVNQQLHQGPLDSQTLYIFQDWKNVPDQIQFDIYKDLLARIDDIMLLAPGWKACKACTQVPKQLELARLAPNLQIGQTVYFTKNGEGRKNFMLDGWGFTEEWGTWATDSLAKIVLPMPEGDPSKLMIKANAFLSPIHSSQIVDIAVNGIRVADHMVLTKAQDNLLEVKLPRGPKTPGEPVYVEFRSIDPISPQAAGIGPDERKLGIGLVSVQFAR